MVRFLLGCFIHILLIFGYVVSYAQRTSNPVRPLQVDELNNRAWFVAKENPETAWELAVEAIQQAQDLDYAKGEADGQHVLGMVNWQRGDLPDALQSFLVALDIRKRIGDTLGLGRSYNNIGNIFLAQHQYDTAFNYFQAGLLTRESLLDTAGIIYSLSNIGEVYVAKNQIDSALHLYEKAETLALFTENNEAVAHINSRYAILAATQAESLDQAAVYWENALAYARLGGNQRQIAQYLSETALMALQNGSANIAHHKKMVEESFTIAETIKATDLQAKAVLLLAQFAALEGNQPLAWQYNQKSQLITERLNRQYRENAIAAITLNDQQQRAAEEKHLHLQNTIIIIVVVSLVIVLLLLLHAYMASRKTYRHQVEYTSNLSLANEELKAKNKDLREFARITSHDLKEPVRTMGAFADLLKKKMMYQQGKEEWLEYTEFIISAAKKLNLALSDLQRYTQLHQDIDTEPVLCNMSDVLTEVINHKGAQIEAKQATVWIAEYLPSIYAHAAQMETLFSQLIDNALTYQVERPPTLYIGYLFDKKSHLFWVQDNGIGIPSSFHEQIFEPFQRLNNQHAAGTGLGLAICKRIVTNMKGRIWVENTPEGGSCFYVQIPFRKGDIVEYDTPVFKEFLPEISIL
ncbi:MAG: tetratricopeptide repeat-containing sensor histidine kinase [Saprospiraceae bacterium]